MKTPPDSAEREFSLADARNIVGDLFVPNPLIYWTDFLLSMCGGGICLVAAQFTPAWSPQYFALMGVTALLFYRAVLFVHELTHLRSGTFNAFRFVWNLLCGIPFLTPSFSYYTHLDHHRRRRYGTGSDGEYLPLGARHPREILLYLAQIFFIPPVVVFRFLVVTPLTWCSRWFRDLVHQRASSLVSDVTYLRPLPARETLRIIRLQEFLCWQWLLCLAWFGLTFKGLPVHPFLQGYLLAVMINGLNSFRSVSSHRFHNDGDEMTFVEQLLDSVNHPRWPLLTELWAPVGQRFHALHHLFPALPYHNLAEAHRRLVAMLPADSPYRLAESHSLIATLTDLWRRASASSRDAKRTPTHRQAA